jgi:hypothetical protein
MAVGVMSVLAPHAKSTVASTRVSTEGAAQRAPGTIERSGSHEQSGSGRYSMAGTTSPRRAHADKRQDAVHEACSGDAQTRQRQQAEGGQRSNEQRERTLQPSVVVVRAQQAVAARGRALDRNRDTETESQVETSMRQTETRRSARRWQTSFNDREEKHQCSFPITANPDRDEQRHEQAMAMGDGGAGQRLPEAALMESVCCCANAGLY